MAVKKFTRQLVTGDIIFEGVSKNSVLVVRAGTPVDKDVKEKLLKWGIEEVFITSDEPDLSESSYFDVYEEDISTHHFQDGTTIYPKSSFYSAQKDRLKQLFYECVERVVSEHRYGFALNNTKEMEELEHIFVSVMSMEVIHDKLKDLKKWDHHSFDHSFDVFLLCWLLGKAVGEENLVDFTIGCLLHDVGKIKVPKEILQKKGKLTQKEYKQVQRITTQYGYELIRNIGLPEEFAIFAKSQYERLDGSGYPVGLQGNAISTKLRILAIIDVYSALTLKKPYRDPIPAEKAMEILFRNREKYDIDLLRIFSEKLHIFPVASDVLLSDGKKATVSSVSSYFPALPNVQFGKSMIAIPFDLSTKVSRLIDWKGEQTLSQQEQQWHRYLLSLMHGDIDEAMNAFELIIDGKQVEDIYLNVIEKSMQEIKLLYRRKMISKPEFNLATSLTQEILFMTLKEYSRKQVSRGKIALSTLGNNLLLLEITAAALKANGWKVYNLGDLPSTQELVAILLQQNIAIFSLIIFEEVNLAIAKEMVIRLKHEIPELFLIIGGSGVAGEAKQWGDLYVKNSWDLVRKLDEPEFYKQENKIELL